jgi:predicted lipoprotein with Yx(FWY)xxD motif
VAVDEVSVAKFGKVLVHQKGLALYFDTANKPMRFACTGDCLAVCAGSRARSSCHIDV